MQEVQQCICQTQVSGLKTHRIETIDVVKRQLVGVQAQLGSKFGQHFGIRL